MRRILGGRKSFPSSGHELFFKFFLAILFLYTCHNLFLSQYSVFRVMELEKATREIKARIEHYRKENRKKEELLQLVREHPEHFREKFAREYMQMQREDEYILIYIE